MIKSANKKAVYDMFVALEKNAYALQMEKNAWGWSDFTNGLSNAWDSAKGAVSSVGNAAGNAYNAAKNYGQAALNRGAAAYHTVMGNDAAAAEKMIAITTPMITL